MAVVRRAAPGIGGAADLTGTSVNPARSLGPALFVGGTALSQLWLFIVAQLVGGALSAVHPADLGAAVLRALVERTGVDPGEIDDVL